MSKKSKISRQDEESRKIRLIRLNVLSPILPYSKASEFLKQGFKLMALNSTYRTEKEEQRKQAPKVIKISLKKQTF